MASDSPTGEFKDSFQYQVPGRSTPPPTTSFLSAKQESTAIEPSANVSKIEKEDDLKEHKEKDKEKDDVDMSSPDANPGYKPKPGKEKQEKCDNFKEDKAGEVKMNGGKNLETQIMLPMEAKDPDEKEDDSCTVNCLYYTMQCCECTIS